MEKDIKSETRGDFEKLLVALLQGQRDELEKPDKAAAKASAEELYKAGAKACFKPTPSVHIVFSYNKHDYGQNRGRIRWRHFMDGYR